MIFYVFIYKVSDQFFNKIFDSLYIYGIFKNMGFDCVIKWIFDICQNKVIVYG